MNLGVTPTVADSQLLAEPPPPKKVAVARLLAKTAPAPIPVSVLSYVVRVVAAVVAIGLLLFGVGWVRVHYAKRLAALLSVGVKSPTIETLVIAVVALGSAGLAYGVFRIGSRHWTKVMP